MSNKYLYTHLDVWRSIFALTFGTTQLIECYTMRHNSLHVTFLNCPSGPSSNSPRFFARFSALVPRSQTNVALEIGWIHREWKTTITIKQNDILFLNQLIEYANYLSHFIFFLRWDYERLNCMKVGYTLKNMGGDNYIIYKYCSVFI